MNQLLLKIPGPLIIAMFLLISCSLSAQFWSEPVNISDGMPGLDNQPDICIDKNGALHCVFTHKLWSNWRKIYYSKSIDDGETWSIPVDISLNPDTSLMNPHIVADTTGKLYVTYDYNTGDPAKTQIHLKSYDGNQWSESSVVCEELNNSHKNQLIIDNNNRLYCFWYRYGESYYRYLENENWSDIIIPYPDEYYWIVGPVVCDADNNLNCCGVYLEEGESIYETKVIYLKYLASEDTWTDKQVVSPKTYKGSNNWDIDLDNNQYPQIVYRQKTNNKGPYSDSTMHSLFDGANWTEPELIISGDTYQQRIVIDPFDRVHIFNRCDMDAGTKLVHYQNSGGYWQGYIIDSAENAVGDPSLTRSDHFIYLAYTYSEEGNDGDILFTKYDILTSTKTYKNNNIQVCNLRIYPNPFHTKTTIQFKVEQENPINISIYNLNGQFVKSLDNKEFLPGNYNITWNGTNKNGKEVTPGMYIISLRSGRFIISKPVEFIE